MEKKVKRKIFILLIVILILIFFSTVFALINSFSEKIINGVFINDINISGLTQNEAKEKLENIIEQINNKEIILQYENEEETIKLSELNVNWEISSCIEEAYGLGRKDNIFVNNFNILKAILKNENISAEISYEENILKEKVNALNSVLPGIVEEPSYYIEDGNLVITKGKAGIKINNELLINEIKTEIYNNKTDTIVILIPVTNKNPDDISIEKVYNEIYKEPQDAYITKDPVTVHPNVNGIDFAISIEEASAMLENEQEEYIIPLKITVAEVTVNDLGEEAFPNTLGTFMTRYDATNKNRSNNISLASEKINGTVIMPGETFSYNQIVGKRTIEAGYKEAGAYAGGKVVQEVGGGICQVSSTLYNAVLYANLEIVERSNHYFETSYVDPGRDATVSWGTVDFKFKNNRTYPIKVEMESENGVCKVSIKGIKEEKEYEVVIQSKVTSVIKKTVKYEEDSSIDSGIEIVDQEGHDGCTSETYKILKLNGTIISNELISSDYYHALDQIKIKGTKITNE